MRNAEKAEKFREQVKTEHKSGDKVSKPNSFASGSANIRPKPVTRNGRMVTLV